MVLQKDVSNNFTKTMFSLRGIIKIISDRQIVTPTQAVIFMCNFHNMINFYNSFMTEVSMT